MSDAHCYKCNKCNNYTTTIKGNLIRHQKSKMCMRGGHIKYHCDKCNKSFQQKGHFEAHLLSNTHLGIIPKVDKRKFKQAKTYMTDYKQKSTFNDNAIAKIMNSDLELKGDEKKLELLEKKYEKNHSKFLEWKDKYNTMRSDVWSNITILPIGDVLATIKINFSEYQHEKNCIEEFGYIPWSNQ